MDLQKLRAIAGLPSIKQASAKPTHDPVLEASDAKFIVSYLRKKFAEFANVNVKVQECIKDHLNVDPSNARVLKEALSLVSKKATFEQNNSLRKMAGLPLLSEDINEDEDEDEDEEDETDSEEEEVEELDSEDKKEVEDAEEDDAEEDDGAESEEKEDTSDTETNDVSELVASIANKLLKDGAPEESELADFLMKVYQAGAADAVSKSSS